MGHHAEMLNFFTSAKRLLGGCSRLQEVADCSDDPLSHPALLRMTLEQLADLPFDRGIRSEECGSIRTERSASSSHKEAFGG
jgi:hypothetical protein